MHARTPTHTHTHTRTRTHTHTPQKKLNDIGAKLNKVTTQQQFFKAREARHRHTVESNYTRVFWWSFLEISIIVAVGVVQVWRVFTMYGSCVYTSISLAGLAHSYFCTCDLVPRLSLHVHATVADIGGFLECHETPLSVQVLCTAALTNERH